MWRAAGKLLCYLRYNEILVTLCSSSVVQLVVLLLNYRIYRIFLINGQLKMLFFGGVISVKLWSCTFSPFQPELANIDHAESLYLLAKHSFVECSFILTMEDTGFYILLYVSAWRWIWFLAVGYLSERARRQEIFGISTERNGEIIEACSRRAQC